MPIRILVVDDAAFIRDMMKKHLRERIAGAEILDACDGNRAIAILKQHNFDLILSDWEMPDMNGEQFLAWVRGEEEYKKIPFVMVSSRGDRDHVLKAVQAGVSDYLTKPFTPDELIKKTVKQLIKVGKDPKVKFAAEVGKNMGHAFGSISALTGGEENKNIVSKKDDVKSAPERPAPIINAPKPAASVEQKSSATTKAQLRFANATYACAVQDISLQALNGTITRDEQQTLPTVFDQAVVDLVMEGGDDIARINAYVHSIQAVENHINANSVKIIVRYVDNDPKKMEVLSKFIGRQKK